LRQGLAWLGGLRALRRAAAGRVPAGASLAVAALVRRPSATIVQVVALSFGLTALLVMAMFERSAAAVARADSGRCAEPLHHQHPADQVQAVAARLKEQGVADAQLFPMVRGRLVAINSNPVDPGRYRAERARGLIEREFNLSYAVEAPAYNRSCRDAGSGATRPNFRSSGASPRRWGSRGRPAQLRCGGEIVRATATSVRELSWDSMKVNFFIIMAPALLQNRPQTFITSIAWRRSEPIRPHGWFANSAT